MLGVAVLAALLGCQPTDDIATLRAECRRAAEHVIDLQLGGAAVVEGDTDLRAHRDNLRTSIDDAYLDHCEATRDLAYVDCALAADDIDAFNACAPNTGTDADTP